MQMDTVLKEIGEFGWYQRRVYALAVLPAVLVAFETLTVIFIFYIPDHRCALPGLDSDTYEVQNANHSLLVTRAIPTTDGKFDQCRMYNVSIDDVSWSQANVTANVTSSHTGGTPALVDCQAWVYDLSTFDSTIAVDFDVVCDRSVHRASSGMISEMGTLSASLVMGFVSDRFGRKLPFCIGGLALVGGGFGIAFVQSLLGVNVCRFIMGVARTVVFTNGLVIGLEIVGPSKRAMAGLLIEMVWCVGEFLLLLAAYIIRDWRQLEIVLSVPSIALLFYWWLIPESPRWLLSKGRGDEARIVLERIARSNKAKLPPVGDATQQQQQQQQLVVVVTEEEEEQQQQKQVPFLQAVRSKEMMVRVVVMLSNQLIITIVYYGLTLNITNLGGNIFINYALNVVMETLGYGSCLLLLDRLGRKPVLAGSLILAGAACTLSFLPIVLGLPWWTVVVLSMTGRFCVCAAFGTILLYAGELFPTVVRSSAMGVVNTFSRIGSLIAPFIADVGMLVEGRYKDALPLAVIGSPALLVGLLVLCVPETRHTALPETLHDLERYWKQRRCPCNRPASAEETDNDHPTPDQEVQTTRI